MIRAALAVHGRSLGICMSRTIPSNMPLAFRRPHALANAILAGDAAAVERYLGFLAAGGADYPLNALKAAGVDMSTPQAVEETFKALENLVDRLEGLIG